MERKTVHQIERENLTNRTFLWIMNIFGLFLPILGIILKLTVWKELPIVFIVFGIIILPSGVLFVGNGIRLLYNKQIEEWYHKTYNDIILKLEELKSRFYLKHSGI